MAPNVARLAGGEYPLVGGHWLQRTPNDWAYSNTGLAGRFLIHTYSVTYAGFSGLNAGTDQYTRAHGHAHRAHRSTG